MSFPIFYVRRSDRLIARLKHLLYGWRFARQAGGKTIMMWPPSIEADGPNYNPSLIFDIPLMTEESSSNDLTFLETTAPFPATHRSLEDPEFASMRNNKFDREFFKQEGLVFHESKLMHYHFRDENPRRQVLNAELRELFGGLPLHGEVKRVLSDFDRALRGEAFVCLHARAGDVFQMMRDEMQRLINGNVDRKRFTQVVGHYVARTAPLELYEPCIEHAIGLEMKIVFSSDSPEQMDWFATRFGSHHFVDLAQFQAKHPIQKALVDFLVLMRGTELFGTRSNYSTFARDLANIEHTIVSALPNTDRTTDEMVDLYYDQAIAKFVPTEQLHSAELKLLRTEIDRHYRFTNRLGNPEELRRLDPRLA